MPLNVNILIISLQKYNKRVNKKNISIYITIEKTNEYLFFETVHKKKISIYESFGKKRIS